MTTIASNQLWNILPTASGITSSLQGEFTNILLQDYGHVSDWLNNPNSYSWNDLSPIHANAVDWLKKLTHSPGAIRLQVSPNYSDEELRLLYAMVSRSLGCLNNNYSYFFDVMDRGLDYTKEAIPISKTKAETGYHTDSTAKHYFPDIVGLLCLQPALSGGESLLTNASNLYNFLIQTYPHLNELLHTPLCRDVITPGTIQNLEAIRANDIPLFHQDSGGGLIFRYMRYWIESALEKLQEPAPQGLQELLNIIDAYFGSSEHSMCFRLERGDMFFANNRFLCHNRTAFVDGEKPRVYVRTWINTVEQE
jgi:hypothetical protein